MISVTVNPEVKRYYLDQSTQFITIGKPYQIDVIGLDGNALQPIDVELYSISDPLNTLTFPKVEYPETDKLSIVCDLETSVLIPYDRAVIIVNSNMKPIIQINTYVKPNVAII